MRACVNLWRQIRNHNGTMTRRSERRRTARRARPDVSGFPGGQSSEGYVNSFFCVSVYRRGGSPSRSLVAGCGPAGALACAVLPAAPVPDRAKLQGTKNRRERRIPKPGDWGFFVFCIQSSRPVIASNLGVFSNALTLRQRGTPRDCKAWEESASGRPLWRVGAGWRFENFLAAGSIL